MKWSMLWDLSVHNTSLPFDHTPAVSTNQNWKRVSVFLCQKNRNRKLRSKSSFLFPLLTILQFDVVHQHLDLRRKQHTNSCRQHVLNPHVLVSLCQWDSSDSFLLWEFLLPRVLHLHHFPFRHLLEIQLVRCHHQLVKHLDSEFSLDLREHCSAIPVSRLLTVLRRTMISIVHVVGLCRFHFSIQVEIESVVFEMDKNEFVLPYQFTSFSK